MTGANGSNSFFFQAQDWRAHLVFAVVQKWVMQEMTNKLGRVKFVQVGANDGVSADPIHAFVKSGAWRGLLVEPIPETFKRLLENYEGIDGLSFANVAISLVAGTTPFFAVKDPHSALSSFSKETVLKHEHWLPEIGDIIEEISVKTIRLDQLLAEFGIAEIDVLVVDTEGFDDVVLSTIDISRFNPKVIAFEHVHLQAEGSRALKEHLASLNYSLIYDGYDCMALAPGVLAPAIVELLGSVIDAAK